MLIIRVCRIPLLPEAELAALCAAWFAALSERLDEGQRAYMERMRSGGSGARLFAGRLLARLALLSAFPRSQKICGDARGLPTLNLYGCALSFAYSPTLAACAFFAPQAPPRRLRFALDIENFTNNECGNEGRLQENCVFSGLRQTKNWLKWEIAVKTRSALGRMPYLARIAECRLEDFAPDLSHAFFALPGHVAAVGANSPLPRKISPEFATARELCSLSRNEIRPMPREARACGAGTPCGSMECGSMER